MNAEIRYYLSIALRRLPLFLLVSLTVASVGLAVAVILPTVYTARGKLLVEDPQIPSNLAASTVQVNEQEQLAILRQRVMTRNTLLEIAREHEVYEEIAEMNADEIVSRMRSDSRFAISGRRDAATLMDVQFEARTGAIAADVVNDYITRILAVNAAQRQSRASETLSFFEQEVERLETELALRNEELLRFQNENRDALPSTLSYRLRQQASMQERLAQLQRDRSALEQQRARLFELQQAGVSRTRNADSRATPEERQLASLRNELSSVRAIYAEESPRVRLLRTRIESLEEQIDARLAMGDSAGEGEAPVDPIQLEIDEIDAELERIDGETARLESEIAKLERTIERTPANAITLEALRRDYDHVLQQYQNSQARLAQASTGERIETLSKGQRITVIEQATAPSEPSDPNRPMIAGMGAAMGIGLGGALAVLLELLNRSIRRPVDLTNGLGITPIATVPYIATPWERLRKRLIGLLLVLVVLAGIPAGLWFVHYEVMPLDLVYDRILSELLP
jgi:polysaccharide chain length determinant protein (PEP-CTERM system associated)